MEQILYKFKLSDFLKILIESDSIVVTEKKY